MSKKIFILLIIFLVVFAPFLFNFRKTEKIEAGSGDNVSDWAWSENIGWISFNCSNPELPEPRCTNNYGVNIDSSTGIFSGYAWSEHIGWISFNSADLVGCPTAPCEAKVNLSNGQVSGWAKVLSVGGGEGWIRLRKDPDYGVWIDTSANPDEFRDWAWSSDFGWISFNHLDCDPNGDGNPSTGPGEPVSPACVEAGRDYFTYPIPDYKVLSSVPISQPPTVDNTSESLDYCACGSTPLAARGLSVTFSWIYDDPESEPQAAYEIWLDRNETELNDENNPKFKFSTNSSFNSYTLNIVQDQDNWVASGELCDPDNDGTFDKLCWSTTYRWKVRVRDQVGVWSEWSLPVDSFTTDPHAYPCAGFSRDPVFPSVNEIVSFINASECYDAAGTVAPCAIWSWTFQDGDPATSDLPDPQTKFISSGSKNITLTVTDSDNFSCPDSDSLDISFPLPGWKEISPF